MIDVDMYEQVRHLYAVEHLSQRAIAKRLGVSRNTVKRYCEGHQMPWEPSPRNRTAPVTGTTVRETVKYWLEADAAAPRKQRHTAQRIHERLTQEGYDLGASTVRRLVRELKAEAAQPYIPLSFDAGEAVQVDWGEGKAYIADTLTTVQLFCIRLCHSCAPFVTAFPNQKEEAFLEGHRCGFEFFGGVTRRAIYDNTKNAVKRGWGKHVEEENGRFRTLRAHYAFRADFCNPGAGHEKGLVEGLVGYIRRNVLVPVPRVKDWPELQTALVDRCLKYQSHRIAGRSASVGSDLARERQCLTPLPERPFEAAWVVETKVRPDGLVTFDRNHYSVPIHLVGHTVTVKGYPLRVEINERNRHLATYQRSYGQGQCQFTLAHYLPLLERRPRAVQNARPLKENLPPAVWEFRQRMSGKDPDREFLEVVKLTLAYSQEAVTTAMEKAASQHQYSLEAVLLHLLEARTGEQPPAQPLRDLPMAVPQVQNVPLEAYDHLLVGGVAR